MSKNRSLLLADANFGAMYISHGRKYLTHENISPLPRSALNLFVNKGVINERPKNKLKVTRVNSGI